MITLSAVLKAAADDRLITRNPCRAASVRPPACSPQGRAVDPAEADAVRAALPARHRAIAECAEGLGVRQGETFGLGPAEVDFLRRKSMSAVR